MNCSSTYTEKDRTKISAKAEAKIAASSDGMQSLLGSLGCGSDFGSMIANASSSSAGGSSVPGMKALLDVAAATAHAPEEAAPVAAVAASKSKPKPKPKAKQQTPNTPAEYRNQIRC